jgi:hypothetical protein
MINLVILPPETASVNALNKSKQEQTTTMVTKQQE